VHHRPTNGPWKRGPLFESQSRSTGLTTLALSRAGASVPSAEGVSMIAHLTT